MFTERESVQRDSPVKESATSSQVNDILHILRNMDPHFAVDALIAVAQQVRDDLKYRKDSVLKDAEYFQECLNKIS